MSAPPALFVAGRAPTIAFDVHLEDRGMVDEPVDCGHRHARIRKHIIPAREGLVGRDQKAAPLIPLGDQLEQHTRFGLVFSDIRQIVQDDEVKAVELGQGRRQLQTLTRGLQFLHDLAGTGEQHAIASVDQGVADGRPKMSFPATGRAEDQYGGPFVQPRIAASQCHDVCFGDHRHRAEVKGGERLGRIQMRLGAMTLDAPFGPLGQFVCWCNIASVNSRLGAGVARRSWP